VFNGLIDAHLDIDLDGEETKEVPKAGVVLIFSRTSNLLKTGTLITSYRL